MSPNPESNSRKRKSCASNHAPSLPEPFDQGNHHNNKRNDLTKLQKCSAKEVAQVAQAAETIKQAMINAAESKFASLQDASTTLYVCGAHIPYSMYGEDTSGAEIVFSPPSRVELDWTLRHGTLRKSELGEIFVDLITQIPSAIFDSKDYLEYRYLRKRALYLSYLVSALQNTKTSGYSYFSEFVDGDELRPALLVDCQRAKCKIRIIPTVSHDLFPLDRMFPDACRADRQIGVPTPIYNSSIIDDACHLKHLDILQNCAFSHKSFTGGAILGSEWLTRLGFSTHLLDGGFGDKEWALLQFHLIETATKSEPDLRLTAFSDSFQLFKSVVKFIANSKPRIGLYIPTLPLQGSQYDLFFKMSRWSFQALRNHALAVISLGESGLSSDIQFQRIFEGPLLQTFDLTVRFPVNILQLIPKLKPAKFERWNIAHRINDHCYDLFSQGLGNRCKTMTFLAPKPPPQALKDKTSFKTVKHDIYNLTVFITLDENNCTRVLDYGPSIEDAASAARFRDFWGGKAELRRFKDGQVAETVMWDSSSPPTEQILSFLYQKLESSPQTNQRPIFYGHESDISSILPSSVEKIFRAAVSEFEMVTNTIRQLKDFPLGFRDISAMSPSLRSTSVNPPLPSSKYLEIPLEVEIELEGSSMWPTDQEQQGRTEFGLLLKLRAELEKTGNFITSRVGIVASKNICSPNCFLDLLTKRQYHFRLYLKHPTVEPFARIGVSLPTNQPPDVPNRGIVHPDKVVYLHASVVRKCHQHKYFASSTRIIKKWFQSHYIASFFKEEMLELFSSIGFSQCSPLAIPASAYCGFQRVIAHLSHWDWRKTPLEIEVLRHFTDDERGQILRRFGTNQSIDRNGEVLLSIALPSENGGFHMVHHPVPCMVAIRMTQLAKETYSQLADQLVPFNALFHPDMSVFDFVIILGKERATFGIHQTYSNVTTLPKTFGLPFIYIQFIDELKAHIGEYALLFPSSDGLIIGGLWKPANEYNISSYNPNSTRGKNTTYNKTAALGLIIELGRGLVDRIRVP